MLKFKNTTIDLGIIEPTSQHFLKWEYTDGTPSDVLSTTASCGSCTTDIITLNNGVQAIFTEGDVDSMTKEKAHAYFPNKLLQITKTINVAIRNGNEPTLIPAPPPAIGTVPNPKIPVITLTFTAQVKLDFLWD
jgi:uncharacterized protein YfaP (DUF2135 family)